MSNNNIAPFKRNDGYVIAWWRDVAVMLCYVSPSITLAKFERRFAIIETAAGRCRGGRIIVAGDLHAKFLMWGSSPHNSQGLGCHRMGGLARPASHQSGT